MKRTLRSLLLWLLPAGFLGIFYFYPLIKILGLSFSQFSFDWSSQYASSLQLMQPENNALHAVTRTVFDAAVELFAWRVTGPVLGFTLWQAFLSTLLTLLVGLPGAYLFARYDFYGKSVLRVVTGIPFVMPTLVVAAGFNALLGTQGWLNQAVMWLFDLSEPPFRFINTLGAILLAHVFYNTTIVLRTVGDFWANLDNRIESAAHTLGANRVQTFVRITLPLLLPAILSATLLVFIFDFSSFAVVLILGGPKLATLEVEIFYQTSALFNLPVAAVLALLQLACTLALTVIYTRLSARVTRPVTRRSKQVSTTRLNTWRKRFIAGIIGGFLMLLLLPPMLSLAFRSITYLGPERTRDGKIDRGFTTIFYQTLFENPQNSVLYVPPARAVGISFAYAAATVVLSLGLGLPAAWALSQNENDFLNRLMDPILMLPLGTSAVTLGLGFIISFNRPPLDLRSSPIMIPLAHTLVAFPFVVRSLVPALRSIQPKLRQVAAVLGASPWMVWRHVDLPMVGRAVMVAAAFAFTISLGEFGATSLISRPEYPTIPTAIYRLLSRPGALNYGQGLALSTILMFVTGTAMFVIERYRVADIGEF